MAERIYLIDGTALVYRSHFAFARNPMVTSSGQNVSAVFGFAQTLFSVVGPGGGRYAAAIFDTAAPTFRHQRYEAYKAHRPPMPEDLAQQLPLVRSLLDAAGITVLQQEGLEADDLIASLAVLFSGQGHEAVIVSIDKDFNQLVRPGITQLIPSRGREPAVAMGPAEVREKWGVPPEAVLDVLALVGDAVDNVPGVRGIGEKTAVRLITEFGSLDALYQRIESIPRASVREKLVAHREDAFLSRELIRLKTDAFETAEIERFAVPELKGRQELVDLLQKLEFRRLIGALGLTGAKEWTASYEIVEDAAGLAERIRRFPGSGATLAIRTEDAGSDPRHAQGVGIALAWEPGKAFYIPIAHEEGSNVPLTAIREHLGPLLANVEVAKTGQNLKSDLHLLGSMELAVNGPLFDVMLASYILDPDRAHDLASQSFEMLGHRKTDRAALVGSGKKAIPFMKLPVARAMEFAAEEADLALRLREVLAGALSERRQEDLYREIEAPLIRVLAAMEDSGVYVDVAQLSAFGRELDEQMGRQAQEVHRLAGVEFNINSPSQLGEVLFEKLKLRKGKKTKTGFSTDSDVLEVLAVDQPIARAVIEYRQTVKLKSTYVDALPPLCDPRTGRIHAQFNQMVAATGRLSSSDPNLQNIPIRSEQGRRIRRAFVPQEPGAVLLSADYSQIELRVLAHLSNDPDLIAAFRAGEDIHRATAAKIFDLPLQSVDPVMRARAKTVNFGVLYGMGPVRLSREMGISMGQARQFIEQYFAKMPSVRAYLEENLARARRDGYVTTVLGRRRYLPSLKAEDARERSQAERIAANTPIQGSAADLIKRAMVLIYQGLTDRRLSSRMILQVHDELLFEGPEEECQTLADLVRTSMETAATMSVPLNVEIGWGRSWAEAHG